MSFLLLFEWYIFHRESIIIQESVPLSSIGKATGQNFHVCTFN